MEFHPCGVLGAWLIEPAPCTIVVVASCELGANEFADHKIDFTPVQANMGLSIRRGTIRGMHYQIAPALEAKLVRCVRGAIFDVVVDLRPIAYVSRLVRNPSERGERSNVVRT